MASRKRSSVTAVYIAELEDFEGSSILTGRFRAHVESEDDGLGEEIEDVSADEAIAWGRERADVVLIRTGDSDYYSAGAENPDLDDLPEWPPADLRLERRRARGFEAMDNHEDDPPVLWDVRVSAEVSKLSRAKPFRDALRDHPATRDVRAPARGYPRASASFLVEASTYGQAQAVAHELFEHALQALDPRSLKRRSRRLSVIGGSEVYPHRPGREVTGPGITY
jgi:hypothetical protein